MGTSGTDGDIVIQQSLDDGTTWSKRTVVLAKGSHGYSTGPTYVIIHPPGISTALHCTTELTHIIMCQPGSYSSRAHLASVRVQLRKLGLGLPCPARLGSARQ